MANFWETSYTISNYNGIELVTCRFGLDEKKISNLFKQQAQMHIALEVWNLAELPLIILLDWSLVLLQQEDSTTVAATGALG